MDINLLMGIALLLLFAKIFGYVATRLKIAPIIGEIFAGILLGPGLGIIKPNGILGEVAGFGILFFLFLIGLSTKFDEIKDNVYIGSFLASGGAFLSVFFGFLIGYFVFSSLMIAFFIGIAIIGTSTAISIRALVDAGRFHTEGAKIMLAVDIADEVIALLTLSLLATYISVGSIEIWKVATLFFAVIGFFLFILTAGSKAMSGALAIFQRFKDEQTLFSIALVVLFIVAFVSEQVGVAAVTGAFLAGMSMSKSHFTESHIVPKVKVIGYGLFIPLFFAYSAVMLDLGSIINYLWVILLLALFGILAKIIGCGYFGRLVGVKSRDAKIIGWGMIPRGEYSIIIAQMLLAASLITPPVYTVIIGFVLVTIILTPILFRVFVK